MRSVLWKYELVLNKIYLKAKWIECGAIRGQRMENTEHLFVGNGSRKPGQAVTVQLNILILLKLP